MNMLFLFVFLFTLLCPHTKAFTSPFKLVSCNVLNDRFYTKGHENPSNKKTIMNRKKAFTYTFTSLDPDIICLQEYESAICSEILKPETYEIKKHTNNFLVIAYKKTDYLFTSIKEFCPNTSNKSCHGFMLLTLKDKKSGKNLGIINAHLQGGGTSNDYYQFRIDQLKKIEEEIKKYEDEKIDAWIMCGDFNLNIKTTEDYTRVKNEIDKNWIDIDETEKKPTCIASNKDHQRLDYIFYKGDLNKSDYKVNLESSALLKHTKEDKDCTGFSDHSPITAIFTYKKKLYK